MRHIAATLLILAPLAATSSGVVRPVHTERVSQPPHACHNKPPGFTCSVTVKLYVTAGGLVDRVEIVESSRDRPCDVSTRLAAAKYRFSQEINRLEYTTTIDSYSCGVGNDS